MGKRGGKFGRRTVLQLGEEVKKPPSYGFGYKPEESNVGTSGAQGLSGLLAHYVDEDGDSGEEEEEEEQINSFNTAIVSTNVPRQMFVAASEPEPPPRPPPDQPVNGNSTKPKSILKTNRKEQPKSILKQKKDDTGRKIEGGKATTEENATKPKAADEVDEKLKDFLAEIDALDHAPQDETPENSTNSKIEDLDRQPLTPTTLGDNDVTDEEWEEVTTDESDKEEQEPKCPKEPTTPWQHCLDEQTQYYYYWNISSNEVTWEIPQTYSQYLLQMKEYEARMTKYTEEKKAWEEQKKNRPKKKKKVLKRKQKETVKISSQAPPPPPPPVNPSPPDTISMPLPKEELLQEVGLPQTVHEKMKGEDKRSSKERKDTKKDGKRSKKSKGSEPVVAGPQLPEKEPVLVGPQLPEKEPVVLGPQLPVSLPPSLPEMKHEKEQDNEHTSPVIGPKLPKELPESGQAVCESDGKAGNDAIGDDVLTGDLRKGDGGLNGDMDDDDFIHQQLEQPVFTHYEYVNKKYQGVTAPSIEPGMVYSEDTFEMDFEDIDRELEMALERKKEARVETDGQKVQQAPGKKRVCPAPDMEPPEAKRLKVNDFVEPENIINDTENTDNSSRRLLRDDIKIKVDSLAEASELANLVIDKLDFLEVNRKGLSDLQVLLIQLETRIEDWKLGGLNTDYLLVKLRHADRELQKYEENAAPQGWSCNWDRCYKKYFYFNENTGDSQWDYPMNMAETTGENEIYQPEAKDDEGAALETEKLDEEISQEVVMDTQPEPSQRSLLDFADLAQAPPPPPGEPPPPGTETEPLLSPEPALSNLIGYDDSSSDSSSSSSESSDDEGDKEKSDEERKDDKSSVKSEGSCSVSNYDPTEPTEEGVDKSNASDPSVQLPVHSKPAHIVAQPVIMRPAPAVSPTPVTQPVMESTSTPVDQTIKEPSIKTDNENTDDLGKTLPNQEHMTEGDGIAEPVLSPAPPATAANKEPKVHSKEKKKKKDKSLSGGGLSMKKKGVSSMVQKWKKVQEDVEEKHAKKRKTQLEDGEIE